MFIFESILSLKAKYTTEGALRSRDVEFSLSLDGSKIFVALQSARRLYRKKTLCIFLKLKLQNTNFHGTMPCNKFMITLSYCDLMSSKTL